MPFTISLDSNCIDGEFSACGTNVTPTNWNCCPNPDGTPRTCKPGFGRGEYACQ
uniref:Uncharacterized protein n=1 Tax=viral metagenome TaxID=1070528 RepID=A0A6C0LEG2_9ZZZZ